MMAFSPDQGDIEMDDKGKGRASTYDSSISSCKEDIKRFIQEGRLPHLLLYGPPGTGKTTTANAVCSALYGAKWRATGSVLELNASDERGIDVVREQIKTFAETRGLAAQSTTTVEQYKIIILDEADAMTSAAQNALRRVMERFVKHVRFIIICNYAGQIIPALQSRCTKFRFSPLADDQLQARLQAVIEAERVSVNKTAGQAIVRMAKGDMRKVLNVVQACAAAVPDNSAITADLVYAVTATAHPGDIDSLFTVLLQEASLRVALVRTVALLQDNAMALNDLITALFERVCEHEMPVKMRQSLLSALCDAEYRVASSLCANESVQTAALVGAFFEARALL